jgi:hypothetical protein
MKPTANTFRHLVPALLPMVFVALSPLSAAPGVASASTNAPQSIFVLPDSPKEGRDPFFPSSLRPYKDRPTAEGVTDLSDLNLTGITTGSGNRVFVIINNVTFGKGEDADVKTPRGKVHIRLVEIRTDSVVIEAGGQSRTLTLPKP